ncbi:tetratricopeptide repeat protein [Streptococcus mutans]|uniref:tetratricopeptide repeat protein n=1 Tax=Streptococcus mutans TaxID=1309 RepID=UPI0028E34BC3|nr:tetratricopeptide repeat protein [Streptococcus mutans]MDT9558476.1 tetratricopeptide repeat protein [Streptococcus mutans]MDT9601572.1 tetratricopeptide repeat protein [Streptococcus mutans]
MFGFFKKKDDKNRKSVETVEEITLSEEAKAELLKKIADGKALVNNDSEKSDEDLAKSYEQIGLWYAELNEVDTAITNLEMSLDKKLSMGAGYKKLMSLYNAKRAEAARNKDNDAIDYYMAKMDEMRNIAKKLTLSK